MAAELYDEIAEIYHLVNADWADTVRRKAEVLDATCVGRSAADR